MKKKLFLNILILFNLLLISFLFECKNNSADDAAKEQEKTALLIGVLSTGTSCPDPAPKFTTLSVAGTGTSCATSGCHDTTTAQSGLDMNSYTSVKAKAKTGDPTGSTLYQKIATGSMATKSNATINAAVYCWIKGGLNP